MLALAGRWLIAMPASTNKPGQHGEAGDKEDVDMRNEAAGQGEGDVERHAGALRVAAEGNGAAAPAMPLAKSEHELVEPLPRPDHVVSDKRQLVRSAVGKPLGLFAGVIDGLLRREAVYASVRQAIGTERFPQRGTHI